MKVFLAFFWLLLGCGAGANGHILALNPDPKDRAAVALAEHAVEVWAAEGFPVVMYDMRGYRRLHLVDRAQLKDVCPDKPNEGCARRLGSANARAYVPNHLTFARAKAVAAHEVGHLLRGKRGHLACLDVPGDSIMCPAGASPGQTPTDRDVAFILSGPGPGL